MLRTLLLWTGLHAMCWLRQQGCVVLTVNVSVFSAGQLRWVVCCGSMVDAGSHVHAFCSENVVITFSIPVEVYSRQCMFERHLMCAGKLSAAEPECFVQYWTAVGHRVFPVGLTARSTFAVADGHLLHLHCHSAMLNNLQRISGCHLNA